MTENRDDTGKMSRRSLLKGGGALVAAGAAVPLMGETAAAAGGGRTHATTVDPNFFPRDPFVADVDLSGKVAVITGGSRGIGLATGLALQGAGATVLGTSRTPAAYPGHPFPLMELDVADPSSVTSFVGAVSARPEVAGNPGAAGIDMLINNAGRFSFGGVLATDPGTYFPAVELSMATLYGGHVALANALFPAVASRAAATGYGRMLFTTSVAAYATGGSEPGTSYYHPYYSGKRSLLAFANCMRGFIDAAGLGVKISTVNPLAVQTDLAKGLRPIFLQPVDGTGNAIGDPFFNDFLAQIRFALDNGIPASVAGEGFLQLLQMDEPDPNVGIGSLDEPLFTQGLTEFALDLADAENAESAYPRVAGRTP